MTQPDRPNRAAEAQERLERVAVQLHHAAQSFEPDGDRIRRLMDARASAAGGSLVPPSEPARGVRGRALLWPVLGSAAAAAVIFAVAAAGAEPDGRSPDSVGSGPAASGGDTRPLTSLGLTGGTPALPLPTSTTVPGSSSRPGQPSGSGGRSEQAPTSGGHQVSPPPTGPSGGAARTDPASTGGTSPAHGTSAPPRATDTGATSTSGRVGGQQVTVEVQPEGSGQGVALGGGGQEWVAASSASDQAHSSSAGAQLVGPVQPLGPGATSGSSPFRVQWQNGTSPNASGSYANWLTSSSSLRVPIRYRAEPATVVLSVGTIGGGGRLEVTVPGSSSPMRVALPSGGGGTAAARVTVTLQAATSGLPSTGDLVVDVVADPGARVGVAAAAMS